MKLPALALALILPTLTALARADASGAGTTAETFVELGTGARAIAMGEAYAAVSGDSETLSYNPAGMAGALSDVEYTHNTWFEGAFSEHVSGLLDLGARGSFGCNLNFLSIPSQQVTERIAETSDPTQNFMVLGSFSPYDTYATIGYANSWSRFLDYGASIKVSGQDISGAFGEGLGVDLGLLSRTSVDGLALGASVQNLGMPATMVHDSFSLPEIVRLGATFIPAGKDMTLSAEFDMPNDAPTALALGFEYDVAGTIFPRFGYRFDGIFNPWSAGFGVKLGATTLEFATVPYGVLGQTFRISLEYRFGMISVAPEALSGTVQAADRTLKLPPQDGTYKITDPETFLALKPVVGDNAHVKEWSVSIFNADKKLVRRFGAQRPVDEEIHWNGYVDGGKQAAVGKYWMILSVRYTDGTVAYSNYDLLNLSNLTQ
jgi:hypothetical protein